MKMILLSAALALAAMPALAASEADANAAFTAAQKAEDQATALKNRWIPTETALKAAEKALNDSNWDAAKAAADEATALAEQSVRQANEEKSAWRDAVIR